MNRRAHLLEETRKAFERRAAERAAATTRGSEPPAPGDLYVLECAVGGGVEWVVMAIDPAAEQGVLAVPADGGSLAGTGDIEIPETSSGGPLTLRCRFAAWLGAEHFESRARIGGLDADGLARARRRWSEIESGGWAGSILAREVDEDPDYQDWIDQVVAPARQALVAIGQSPGEAATGRAPIVGRRASRRPPFGFRPPALLAASILFLAMGVAGSMLWRRGKTETLLARRQAVAVNLAIAALEPSGGLRGEVETIRLPAAAGRVILLLVLDDSSPLPKYRVELARQGTGESLWHNDEVLPVRDPAEIRLDLPSSLLAPGDYQLRLLGWEDGRFRPAGEYLFRIEASASRR